MDLKLLYVDVYFLDPTLMSTDKFKTMCQSNILNVFVDQWKETISRDLFDKEQSNKLRFYSQFKTSFERELYFDSVMTSIDVKH